MLNYNPSRNCSKCGGQAERRYDQNRDLIERKCASCGYSWHETPIDKNHESNIDEGQVLLG
jgi:Zn ribbon nucleic-acid-binding protein